MLAFQLKENSFHLSYYFLFEYFNESSSRGREAFYSEEINYDRFKIL